MGRTPRKKVGRPPALNGRLARWIDARGLRRDDVAERLGIHRKYLDNLCRLARRPSLDVALAIERLTGGDVTAAHLATLTKHSKD